jgi:hypothetical protein
VKCISQWTQNGALMNSISCLVANFLHHLILFIKQNKILVYPLCTSSSFPVLPLLSIPPLDDQLYLGDRVVVAWNPCPCPGPSHSAPRARLQTHHGFSLAKHPKGSQPPPLLSKRGIHYKTTQRSEHPSAGTSECRLLPVSCFSEFDQPVPT